MVKYNDWNKERVKKKESVSKEEVQKTLRKSIF